MSASRLVALTLVAFGLGLPQAQGQSRGDDYKAKVLAAAKKIDELIAAKQKEAGVKAGPRAPDGTFFRRLNIDLVGRIPAFQDVGDYLENDDPDKLWIWVDNLLSDPRNAPHLATIFRQQILGAPNQMTAFQQPQFEAYLRERFAKNAGYDKIVHEILTSGNPDPRMGGGGFPGGGAGANPSVFFFANENKPENLAAATTRVFLGVKLECAQCHAHPFAKWTKEQFWEMAAFYSGRARFAPRPMVPGMAVGLPKPGEIEIPGTKKVVKAKFLDGVAPPMDESADPQKILADWLVSAKNPYFPKATADFIWSQFFGVSILEPILEPSEDAPITHPELLDLLAKELVDAKFDLKHLIRIIVHTEAYHRASTSKEKAAQEDYNLFVRMPVRGMTPEQLFDSLIEATFDAGLTAGGPAMGFDPFGGPRNARSDFLNRFASTDRRHETQTSILQALFLMNGNFLAERMDETRTKTSSTGTEIRHPLKTLMDQPTGTDVKIKGLYKLVLSRLPEAPELERLIRYVDEGGPTGDRAKALKDVYWALLNSGEFMLNH